MKTKQVKIMNYLSNRVNPLELRDHKVLCSRAVPSIIGPYIYNTFLYFGGCMIKKVIFDLDNTLMPFPKHFEKGFKEVLNKHNVDIEPILLYKAIGTYETSGKYIYYNKA